MELYHVSCNLYLPGDIINSQDFEDTFYYSNSKSKWIDDLLDDFRPQNCPSRKKTLYAFGKLEHCMVFINTRCNGNEYYYKVKMTNPIACPMCLTGSLENTYKSKHEELIKEYWEPLKGWSYLEYLSEQMEVMEQIALPQNIVDRAILKGNGMKDYERDLDLYRKIVG